ncbi:MAG: endolytic transglycosylase MltG [Acidobacteria bacterium]|nr:endolytic transglycosylase MltG [Acidobacteriota bacterium]
MIPEETVGPRGGRRPRARLLLVGLLVLPVFGASAAGAYGIWATRGSASGDPVHVVIPQGASAGEIAGLLAERGVIRAPWLFRVVARFRGVSRDLRAGKYDLRTGLSYAAVIAALRKGPAIRFTRVTIPEGKTVAEVAAIIGARTRVSAREFLAALASARPARLPAGTSNPEGFLFPKTYDVLEDATATDVVALLLRQFDRETASLDWSRAKGLGVTPYQAVVIASMIEREAKVAKDRPLISAVVYNRLRARMRLQIDATVQYAIFLRTGAYKPRLLYRDLEIASPYNTYLHDGLPPSPIASPGIDSLRAALDPARVPYLYYVLMNERGEHGFATTAREFARLKSRAMR